jgi:hypothetical protein
MTVVGLGVPVVRNKAFRQVFPLTCLFYHERKVSKGELYAAFEATLVEYNVLASYICAWIDSPTGLGIIPSEYSPGLEEGCMAHLEQSFDYFYDC